MVRNMKATFITTTMGMVLAFSGPAAAGPCEPATSSEVARFDQILLMATPGSAAHLHLIDERARVASSGSPTATPGSAAHLRMIEQRTCTS